MTDPECVLSKSVSLECWDGSQEVCGSCHALLISPHESCQRWSHFPSKGARGPMDLYFENLCPLPGLGESFFVQSWEIISSLLSPPFLAPRSQWPHEAPWGDKSPGWPAMADCSEFQHSCTLCYLSVVLYFMLSCIHPPTTFNFFFPWLTFLFFVFSFPAACHGNDTRSAKSALDSFLQTRTTNSPVREQSERKMKNNIRKEPFGKLHKKCYIKIDTRAWPFVVLYILKPSIDSLLITCLF